VTEARTVRYLIAMFVTAVLAVIAIGVGVVAAVTNPNVYGPSWGRFTAAFPGRVYVSHLGPIVSTSNGSIKFHNTRNTFTYANKPFSGVFAHACLRARADS
jgi:hypothetical protein